MYVIVCGRFKPPSLPIQALIVVNGYKYTHQHDWTDILFRHVVIGGDFKYLSDFKRIFPVNMQLLEDLVKQ